MSNIVHIVHCIDTEGPLSESLIDTFDRLKNIYGIKLKPTKDNLKKIQLKKFNFNGLEDEIKERNKNPHSQCRMGENAIHFFTDRHLDNFATIFRSVKLVFYPFIT